MKSNHPANAVTGILVLCAVIITGLVVRREVAGTRARPIGSWRPVPQWYEVADVAFSTNGLHSPVRIVEFFDTQCEYCRDMDRDLRVVERIYGDRVAVARLHYPLPHHEQAYDMSLVLECSREQERFDDLLEVVFDRSDLARDLRLDSLGILSGIPDVRAMIRCAQERRHSATVDQHMALGQLVDVQFTPTIMIEGQLMAGRLRLEPLRSVIDSLLLLKEI